MYIFTPKSYGLTVLFVSFIHEFVFIYFSFHTILYVTHFRSAFTLQRISSRIIHGTFFREGTKGDHGRASLSTNEVPVCLDIFRLDANT